MDMIGNTAPNKADVKIPRRTKCQSGLFILRSSQNESVGAFFVFVPGLTLVEVLVDMDDVSLSSHSVSSNYSQTKV